MVFLLMEEDSGVKDHFLCGAPNCISMAMLCLLCDNNQHLALAWQLHNKIKQLYKLSQTKQKSLSLSNSTNQKQQSTTVIYQSKHNEAYNLPALYSFRSCSTLYITDVKKVKAVSLCQTNSSKSATKSFDCPVSF